ncbi:MAG TPA: hypothetical protein EYP67_04800 [Methanosarcinales archaeon]|nr:hypothetical protein [Methanosarcinales archaeon]
MIIRRYEEDITLANIADTLAKMGFKVSRVEEGRDLYYSDASRMYTENNIRVRARRKLLDKMVIEMNSEMNIVFVHGDETDARAFLDNLARI